ncbi:ABC transporter substrate-binding protein [Actinomadura napierensis]|uniref:ABC transporter substrate-binding protein n=1 Tax=Actinomadura napierensis TaxID=267854 RepID=A0ABP5LG90_9ACTN
MRRTTTPFLACALIAGLATACGNSESGSGSVAADSPVTIMVSGTLSSPNLSYPQAATGALAAAQAINKAGGVDGHPIKVVQCNDQLNPSTALACVRKAAQQRVVAMVGGIDLFTAQLWPTLKAAGIPWVGLDVISADQATNAMSYPMTGGTVTGFYQAGRLAVQKGGKQVAIVKHENPQSAFVAGLISAGVASAGGTVTGQIVSKIGNSDPSPAAAQATGKKPDAIACACNAGDGARILKAVRQAGFSKPFAAGYPTLLDTDIQSLGALADNTYTPSDIADPSDPKASMFYTQMRAQDPKARRDGISAGAWLGTYSIAQLLKGQSSLTSATLVRRLNTAPAIDTHGLTGGSISFAKPGVLPQYPRIADPYVIDYVVTNGKRTPVTRSFVSVYGGA